MEAPSDARQVVVGIVGAGTMGTGIAQVCLVAGHEVILHDIDPRALERATDAVADGLLRLVERGRLQPGDREAALARLVRSGELAPLTAAAELVIEAVPEDLTLKRGIFRALDMQSLPDVLLATNTSSFSVAHIAEATHHRERVLGLHFFNPAPLMALVEVAASEWADRSAVDRGVAFVRGLDRTPVVCQDVPGYIVNRINRPFTLEALHLLDIGCAGVEEVDRALEATGYSQGPFALLDMVGVDVSTSIARSLYRALGEPPRFRPSPIVEWLVAGGWLGRKSGAGFYRYDADGTRLAPSELAWAGAGSGGTAGGHQEPLSGDAIVERIELAIINEAYRAVGEGLASPDDIDLAMRLGAGHPWGPFERAGRLGLRAVVEGLHRQHLHDAGQTGDRFEVAPLLWQLATV